MKLLITILIGLVLMTSTATAAFVHPGAHVNAFELQYTKDKVDNGVQPWAGAFANLQSQSYSSLSYNPSPRQFVYQGPYAQPDVGGWAIMLDGRAAYAHALLWVYTEDTRHADKAAQILNAWATTLEDVYVSGDCPPGGNSCINGELLIAGASSSMANAAEILKHWPGYDWDLAQIANVESMFRDIFYHRNQNFKPGYNGNWDTLITQGMMAMGVFLDDQAMFDRAVEYYQTGIVSEGLIGNGVITNYIPDETGLTQETYRDSEHEGMGVSGLIGSAQIAMHQGVDLYGYANSRLYYGVEGSNLRGEGSRPTWGVAARMVSDGIRPEGGWEMVYNHYNGRLGMPMPNVEELLTWGNSRPERYGTFSGIGFGTLTSYGVPVEEIPDTCSNGIQDGFEDGIDCGGMCGFACPVCEDGVDTLPCTFSIQSCAGVYECVDGQFSDVCTDVFPDDECPVLGDYIIIQNGIEIPTTGIYGGQSGLVISNGWNCESCDQTSDAYNSIRTPTGAYSTKRLMKFDTSFIDPSRIVLSATLELYEDNQFSATSNVRASKILKDWGSDATYRCTNDAGHDGCISPEIFWDALGLESNADRDSANSVTTLVSNGWNSWDFTGILQDWVSNPSSNYGLLLEEMDGTQSQRFRDYDYSDQETRPKLTVVLAPEVVNPCVINSVSWSKTAVYDNQDVQLNINSADCEADQFVVELREIDDNTYRVPSLGFPTSLSGDTISVIWNAKKITENDGSRQNEYQVLVYPVSDPTFGAILSNILLVKTSTSTSDRYLPKNTVGRAYDFNRPAAGFSAIAFALAAVLLYIKGKRRKK